MNNEILSLLPKEEKYFTNIVHNNNITAQYVIHIA